MSIGLTFLGAGHVPISFHFRSTGPVCRPSRNQAAPQSQKGISQLKISERRQRARFSAHRVPAKAVAFLGEPAQDRLDPRNGVSGKSAATSRRKQQAILAALPPDAILCRFCSVWSP